MDEVRRLRLEKGWSQNELAYHAKLAPSVISLIETGKRDPNATTLRKLAEALEVRIPDLFEESGTGKAQRRSSPEPKLFNGPNDERRTSILADAIVAAADTWLEAVSNPDIDTHKRFGYRDAAIDLFDRINARAIGELRELPTEARNEIVRAMGKLNEIPEEAYRAMPDETLKEALEERRRKMREWTRRIA